MTMSELVARGPVILAFTRSTCSHCREELPILQKLADKSWFESIQVVAVNVKESAETVHTMWDELDLRLPCVLDESMKVTRAYGVPSLPRLCIVDQGGVLLHASGKMEEPRAHGLVPEAHRQEERLPGSARSRRAVRPGGHALRGSRRLSPRGLVPRGEGPSHPGSAGGLLREGGPPGRSPPPPRPWTRASASSGGTSSWEEGTSSSPVTTPPRPAVSSSWGRPSAGNSSPTMPAFCPSPAWRGITPFVSLAGQLAESTDEGGAVTPEVLIPWDQQAVGILRYVEDEAGRPQGFGGILNKT